MLPTGDKNQVSMFDESFVVDAIANVVEPSLLSDFNKDYNDKIVKLSTSNVIRYLERELCDLKRSEKSILSQKCNTATTFAFQENDGPPEVNSSSNTTSKGKDGSSFNSKGGLIYFFLPKPK